MMRNEKGRRLGTIRRCLRRIIHVTLVSLALWTGGLIWFAAQLPRSTPRQVTTTDAIIVLTGGTGRLETGLQLLAETRARNLFVSGVARGIDVAALLRIARRSPDDLACCIAIGYHANGFNSLHLVTANYHMPRSLLEFRRAMATIRIVAHPVFPQQFKIESWWRFPGTATLLSSEFNKYLIARLAIGLGMKHGGDGAT
jgi:uncharacterized SAM-binding protein YcdF (DUF218 family)